MSNPQEAALIGMFFIGFIPLAVAAIAGRDMPTCWRTGIFIWGGFWCLPPLLSIWIKGVFG